MSAGSSISLPYKHPYKAKKCHFKPKKHQCKPKNGHVEQKDDHVEQKNASVEQKSGIVEPKNGNVRQKNTIFIKKSSFPHGSYSPFSKKNEKNMKKKGDFSSKEGINI